MSLSSTSSSTINIFHLLSLSISLIKKSSSIIKYIHKTNQLYTIDKNTIDKNTIDKNTIDKNTLKVNNTIDPTTLADLLSQENIIGKIGKYYPNINIIGEEDNNIDCIHLSNQKQEEILNNIENLNQDDNINLLDEFNYISSALYNFPMEDVTIWVDPLDGTKEYTKGIMEAVTVLIGISINGIATAGIISYPYTNDIYWGLIGLGSYKLDINNINDKLVLPKSSDKNRIITTSSHMTDELKDYLDQFNGNIIRFGGCGAKTLKLINNEADAYLYPFKGTKRWDTCAPDAILNAAGGKFTDSKGKPIIYTKDIDYNNYNGLMATLHDDHKKYLRNANL